MSIPFRQPSGAPFYVLKHTICAAVLGEVGYLTNYEEERLLRTSVYQKKLAAVIAQGVGHLRQPNMVV